MALMTRISRLMKADMNAVLDRIEEPDLVLRQAVRDMDEEHQAQARQIDRLTVEIQQQIKSLKLSEQALADIEPQLDDCFAAERDDLARELVQRRLELNNALTRQTSRLESLHAEHKQKNTQQRDNEIQLQCMRQKLDVLSNNIDSTARADRCGDTSTVSVTDVDIAFVQEKQKRSRS